MNERGGGDGAMNVNESTLQDFGSEISLGGVLLPLSRGTLLQHHKKLGLAFSIRNVKFLRLFEAFFGSIRFLFMILQQCKTVTVTLATEHQPWPFSDFPAF